MDLGGRKELEVTVKSIRTCSVGSVCLDLAVSTGFGGGFGPKKAIFGHKMHSSGSAPPDLARPSWEATGDIVAENLDLARAAPRLLDG